jgi:hypothetical protein
VIASLFAKPVRIDMRMASVEWLACIVVGHMAVSMLFEPDLGSYTRHLTSVVLFVVWRLSLLAPFTAPLTPSHASGKSADNHAPINSQR